MPTKKTKFIVRAAIIAAAYAVLTLALAPLAFGSLQLRLSEALTVLAYFSPAAVCGLTVGCAVANLWSPFGITDVVFGALATGVAAVITYFMPKKGLWKFLAPLPSVLVNAAVIRRGDRGVPAAAARLSGRPTARTHWPSRCLSYSCAMWRACPCFCIWTAAGWENACFEIRPRPRPFNDGGALCK